jgi:hypothetical protein
MAYGAAASFRPRTARFAWNERRPDASLPPAQVKEGVDSVDGVEGVLYQVPETLPAEVRACMRGGESEGNLITEEDAHKQRLDAQGTVAWRWSLTGQLGLRRRRARRRWRCCA